MMGSFIAVFFGGGLGACLRWGMVRLAGGFGLESAWAILLVNLTGAFIMGVALGLGLKALSEQAQLFLFIGLLGGFTTFSTLSADVLNLAEKGLGLSLFYLITSIAGGLLLLVFGLRLGAMLR